MSLGFLSDAIMHICSAVQRTAPQRTARERHVQYIYPHARPRLSGLAFLSYLSRMHMYVFGVGVWSRAYICMYACTTVLYSSFFLAAVGGWVFAGGTGGVFMHTMHDETSWVLGFG